MRTMIGEVNRSGDEVQPGVGPFREQNCKLSSALVSNLFERAKEHLLT